MKAYCLASHHMYFHAFLYRIFSSSFAEMYAFIHPDWDITTYNTHQGAPICLEEDGHLGHPHPQGTYTLQDKSSRRASGMLRQGTLVLGVLCLASALVALVGLYENGRAYTGAQRYDLLSQAAGKATNFFKGPAIHFPKHLCQAFSRLPSQYNHALFLPVLQQDLFRYMWCCRLRSQPRCRFITRSECCSRYPG
jgi:hypothetical protein